MYLVSQLLIWINLGCVRTQEIQDTADAVPSQSVESDSGQDQLEPTTVIAKLPISGERVPSIETLSNEQANPIALSGFQTLLGTGGSWKLDDETQEETIYLGEYGNVSGLTLDSERSILLLDEGVFIFDGETLEPSPIGNVLPLPTEQVFGTRDSMWFWGAGNLFHYELEQVSQIMVPNHNVHQFVYGPSGTHALTLPELQLIEKGEDGFEGVDYRSDILPEHMVFDRTGALWVSDGSPILYQRNGNRIWSGLELDEPIVQLLGGDNSADLWIKTETQIFHHRAGEFYQVSIPEGEWVDVDEYGRLLILTESGVQRVSIERTVVVVGLRHEQALDGVQELTFLPMLEDSLDSLNVWIDQTTLSLDDNRTIVDANDYSAGVHTLRMVATGEEGTSITEVPFVIGDLPDVAWDGDIDLLSQRHCNDCHGETSFLPLYTSEQWEENISLILSEVLGNEMPKGGPYLSAEEIQMIRGWQSGGFQ
jgi:hypothetical protein